jgi:alpha-glucosidase
LVTGKRFSYFVYGILLLYAYMVTKGLKRLGDNLSTWEMYRISIAGMLSFASIFHIPMVGSDVCGFGGNTNETLCARWAALGAFYPFYRNHNQLGKMPQEFYRWPSVAESARKAIDIRYRLLDYLYTAFHRQTVTGEPFLQPLFYLYPGDSNTFPVDLQFFFGDAILVSPVTDDESTEVNAYFPDDIFYDWYTGSPFRGHGENVTLSNVNLTSIPLHICGGNIVPARTSGANTTTELRKKGFNIIIAPGLDGTAKGSLYMDDGDSLKQEATLDVAFDYSPGKLRIKSSGEFKPGVSIELITILGQNSESKNATSRAGSAAFPTANDNKPLQYQYDPNTKALTINTELPLSGPSEVFFVVT